MHQNSVTSISELQVQFKKIVVVFLHLCTLLPIFSIYPINSTDTVYNYTIMPCTDARLKPTDPLKDLKLQKLLHINFYIYKDSTENATSSVMHNILCRITGRFV